MPLWACHTPRRRAERARRNSCRHRSFHRARGVNPDAKETFHANASDSDRAQRGPPARRRHGPACDAGDSDRADPHRGPAARPAGSLIGRAARRAAWPRWRRAPVGAAGSRRRNRARAGSQLSALHARPAGQLHQSRSVQGAGLLSGRQGGRLSVQASSRSRCSLALPTTRSASISKPLTARVSLRSVSMLIQVAGPAQPSRPSLSSATAPAPVR